jgi:hypothetical protein
MELSRILERLTVRGRTHPICCDEAIGRVERRAVCTPAHASLVTKHSSQSDIRHLELPQNGAVMLGTILIP